jgi:transposase
MDETTLRHLPPLRAAWSPKGQQAVVPITGQNARRSLFGALDLKSGRRVFMARAHRRLADFHAFLRRLRAGAGKKSALWLLLDNHGSHKSPRSVKLADELNINLFWLPRQCPELNPVDHLWGGLKNTLAANRQFPSVDDQVRHALAWLHRLSPRQTLRKAGLLSPRCWLREVRNSLWPAT